MLKTCNGPCKLDKTIESFHRGNGSFGRKSRCIECCKISYKPNSNTYKREYYRDHAEKIKDSTRRYQDKNREALRKRNREYDANHKPQRAAREAFRRAQKLCATPKWLTDEHRETIKQLYVYRDELRHQSGIMYHVDHIVPLVSKTVCGLHVPWNLQVILGNENLKKSNRV